MFFFVFGRYKKLKVCEDQSPLQHKRCINPNCMGRRVELMEKSSTCHLMFIPLIPMGSVLVVRCLDCRLVSELDIHNQVWNRHMVAAAKKKKKQQQGIEMSSSKAEAAATPLAVTEATLVTKEWKDSPLKNMEIV